VSAAVAASAFDFDGWFSEFSAESRHACLDTEAPKTTLRHRWLDLATRDLVVNERNAWITLCHIVRRSDASSINTLSKDLVAGSATGNEKQVRFRSHDKLMDALDLLMKRRLIGMDESRERVDVHPVVRGHVTRYILQQYELGTGNRAGEADKEVIRHLEAGNAQGDIMLRLLNMPDPTERLHSLETVVTSADENPFSHKATLGLLQQFYPATSEHSSPWLDALPALSFRKDQAWCLLRTGAELMTVGRWDESPILFRRAELAYRACGDLESVALCHSHHDWQYLYGGSLWKAERSRLETVEQKTFENSSSEPYWLALLLAIRQSEQARTLIETLEPYDRWSLQTLAEAWFYMDEYEKAVSLAREAWQRRKDELQPIGQALWEAVTLGLALVRLGKVDEAFEYLSFAHYRGVGWYYNIVPMFALAGYIEFLYKAALRGPRKFERLTEAELAHIRYCRTDPDDRCQIAASEAHLAMAKVLQLQAKQDEATQYAIRALQIARGSNPPFSYTSVLQRATKFLGEDLGIEQYRCQKWEKGSAPTGYSAHEHDERVAMWLRERSVG
jgi:tetratricopeptide (TPR) repeat protein